MTFSFRYRLIKSVRSFLSRQITNYDPFANKLVEQLRINPHHPFLRKEKFTFEYQYRRWSSIFVLSFIEIFVVLLAIFCYVRFSSDEYWATGSTWIFFISFGLVTSFVFFNLVENFKLIRVVLSPLDFQVSIYVENTLKQRCSIDRAYICLHRIQSYDVVLYHLVFIVEDVDFIEISDYFTQKFRLRLIGQRLAENLFVAYFENETRLGIFPKYKKLNDCIRRQQRQTVKLRENSTRTNEQIVDF